MVEKINLKKNETRMTCPECEFSGLVGAEGELVASEAKPAAKTTRASKKAS